MILHIYDVGSPLAVDSEAAGNFLNVSAIQQKDARQGVFSGRPSGVEEGVGYYNRSAGYSDLGGQNS